MGFELIAWVALRDPAGRVLLARREGTGRGDGLWNLPGGHVKDGEPAAEAAAREAGEEVGALLESSALRQVGVQRFDIASPTGRTRGFNLFYEASGWLGELSPGHATSELGWFAPDALPGDILPWLPAAITAHLVDGRFWVESVS